MLRLVFVTLVIQLWSAASAQIADQSTVLNHDTTYDLSVLPGNWDSLDLSSDNKKIIYRSGRSYQIWRLDDESKSADFICKFPTMIAYRGCVYQDEDFDENNADDFFESSLRNTKVEQVRWHSKQDAMWVVTEPRIGERDRTAHLILDDGQTQSSFLTFQFLSPSIAVSFARHCDKMVVYNDFPYSSNKPQGPRFEARFIEPGASGVGEQIQLQKSEPIFGQVRPHINFWPTKLSCESGLWAFGSAEWSYRSDNLKRYGQSLIFNLNEDGERKYWKLPLGEQRYFALNEGSKKVLVYSGTGPICDADIVVSHGPCQGEMIARKSHPVLSYWDAHSGELIWVRRQDVGGNIRPLDPVILPDGKHALVTLQPIEYTSKRWRDYETQTLEVIRLTDGVTVQSISSPARVTQVEVSRDRQYVTVFNGKKNLMFFRMAE